MEKMRADYAPSQVMGGSGAIIGAVEPGSPAARSGLAAGMAVQLVDGQPLGDILDWFWLADGAEVSLTILDSQQPGTVGTEYPAQVTRPAVPVTGETGDSKEILLRREWGEPWGIEFADPLFDGLRTCRNDCLFCFMKMLPSGMRPALYLRDDDYRLSFLQGNFVTLSNLSAADLQRIVAMHLSPLHVSLHAVTPAIREQLMGRNHQQGLDALEQLLAAGIEFHAQMVLMPGINDGAELERSLDWLAARPQFISTGIVPYGYTRHARLQTGYTPQQAAAVIAQVGERPGEAPNYSLSPNSGPVCPIFARPDKATVPSSGLAWTNEPGANCPQSGQQAINRRFPNSGGFTLVELIVALAIAAILMTLSISILSTAMNVSAKVTSDATNGKVSDLVLDFCEERLVYARYIRVFAAPAASDLEQLLLNHPNQAILYIGDETGAPATRGYVYYRPADAAPGDLPVNAFGQGFYQDGTVQLTLSEEYYTGAEPWVMVIDPAGEGFINTSESKPTETVSVTLFDRQGSKASSSTRSLVLVNAEARPDYVTDGLIASYDAINNTGWGDSTHSTTTSTWADLSGHRNDLQLNFTGQGAHLLERSIYFDGSGDYAYIPSLNLTGLDTVTVEICYRQTSTETSLKRDASGVLFEFSSATAKADKGFGLIANWGKQSAAYGYTYSYMGAGSDGGLREANYATENNTASFATHTNIFSMSAEAETPRRAWVNAAACSFLTSDDPPVAMPPKLAPYARSEYFSAQGFWLAGGLSAGSVGAPDFCGEIAAIRIYNRALTPEEAAQNAAQDALRFSGQ